MRLLIYHPSTSAVWADALFVSVLQRSDEPGTRQVRRAIDAAVSAYGSGGCAQRVAQEFGDHPGGRGRTDALGPYGGRRGVRVAAGTCAGQRPKTAGTPRCRPADMPAGRDMKRVRIGRSAIRRGRPGPEDLPADPRDPDVVRAKALTRVRPTGSSRSNRRAG